MATAEKAPARAGADQPAPRDEDRYRFTVAQYYQMAEAGVFGVDPRARVELIDGDVYQISPIGSPHHGCVNGLNNLLGVALRGRAILSIQGPIRLSDDTEPEPGVAVLRPRPDYYRGAHPGPADVLLLIEVMVSSAPHDRDRKLPRYARSGVPEVWLVDLDRERIETYRGLLNGVYSEIRVLPRGESVAPEAFPDAVLTVDAILG